MKKSGYTLVEVLVTTAMLGLLVLACVPFLIKVSESETKRVEIHRLYLEEFSDVNNALASKTYDELMSLKTENIDIKKVENTHRLYLVTGKETKVNGYVVLKESSVN